MTSEEMIAELEELLRHSDNPAGFYTVTELAEMAGVGKVPMHRRLQLAMRAGRLEVVKVLRPAIDGRMLPAPAYRIMPEKS